MDEFFRLNPGMSSRVAHHIDFPDYTLDELLGDRAADARGRVLRADRRRRERVSGVPRAARRASRGSPTPAASATRSSAPACGTPTGSTSGIEDGHAPTLEELVRIEAQDILKSSVFDERGTASAEADARDPVILGVVGDSAAGKTTITRGLVRVLGEENVAHICTDDYHRYDRRQRAELGHHAAAPRLQLHRHHRPAPRAPPARRADPQAGLPPPGRDVRTAGVRRIPSGSR